jgi:hypothetical protein
MLASALRQNQPKLINACCGSLNVLDDGPANSKGAYCPDSMVDRFSVLQPPRLTKTLSHKSLNAARQQLSLLEEALTCPVEQEIATQVTRLSCGHAFSQSVAETLARQSSPCPCCRRVVLHEQLDAEAEQAARVLREAFPAGLDSAPDTVVTEFSARMPPLKDYMYVAPPPPDPAVCAEAMQYYVNILLPRVREKLQDHNYGNPQYRIVDFRIRNIANHAPLTRYPECFTDDGFRQRLVQQITNELDMPGQQVSLCLQPTQFFSSSRVLKGSGFCLIARVPIEQMESQARDYYVNKLTKRLLSKVAGKKPMRKERKSGVCIRMQWEGGYSTLTRYIYLFAHRPQFWHGLTAALCQALSAACGSPIRVLLVEESIGDVRNRRVVLRYDIYYQVVGRNWPLSAALAV